MKTYTRKLRHILPTYLIISIGSVVGLLLIRWIFCIHFSVIDIKEEVWELWLPLIFPWIPISLWLRQRFRVLAFKKEEDKRRFFFQFISWFAIATPLCISQAYLTTAAGKLQQIDNIAQIEKREKARYYKIGHFAVAPYYGGSYTDFRTSGRYNENLNIDVYFVAPILSDTSEKITGMPRYWYGVKYGKQINNKLSNEEKEKIYAKYYEECVQKMNAYDFYSLDHFERTPTSDHRENFLKAVQERTEQPAGDNIIILQPVTARFEDRNGHKLAWIFRSFAIGLGVLLFSLIWPGYSEEERRRFFEGKKPEQDDLADAINYLMPKGDHFATSIILDLNILVYLLMIFSGINIISPNGPELLKWGANRRMETMNGEWWRLLTSMFVHGGIMHLILNIVGLVIAAIFIEPVLGRARYFILYILSGLCGSLASIFWYSHTVSVGASGAIFGLYGAILGLLLTNAFPKDSKKGLLWFMGFYVGINLLWGLTGGIDNAAHIGGLISGAILGLLMYKRNNKDEEEPLPVEDNMPGSA